ncbi:MAG: Ger(x)C family spore germination protein [Paenibacillaceae bacterium]|nr:Ger(x)C family spore germination protein [Paenibacillaceae bacterium]
MTRICRQWMFACLLVGLVVTLSSCGYKDIDKRFFVVSMGIDHNAEAEEDSPRYNVLLKLAIPQADVQAGQEEFILLGEKSDSITNAVRKIKAKVDKELDFSHTKVILFGEDVVKEGDVNRLLDWFMRRRDIQKIAWVGVARPNAEKVLQLKPKSERLPSNALFLSFGQSGTESAFIVSDYLFSFRKRLTERGLDPVLPIIEAEDNELLQIDKSVFMNKDKSLGLLNPEETKLLNLITNRTEKADLEVKTTGTQKFYISINKAKTKYKIKIPRDSEPYAEVNIKLVGTIEESSEDIDPADTKQLKEEAEKRYMKKAEALLSKLQARGADPVGFGLIYRGTHSNSDDWRQWEELYPRLTFKVKIEVRIQGFGGLR